MQMLVTGATGFTGGHLARALQACGHRVRALVRKSAGQHALERAGIEVASGDLTNAGDVLHAAEGCDVIYHIAAAYREAKFRDEYYRQVNVEGTRHVLDAALRCGVGRTVHCSTVGVHGDILRVPADENTPFAPGDIYQRTKLEAELLARERFQAGLPGCIFRPQGIYGPGDLRFLKLFKAIYNGRFRMIGSGKVFYHMTFIDDLIEGIKLCGEHPAAVGQTYIFGGPRYTTVRELVESVARVMQRRIRRGRIPVTPFFAAATVCEWLCRPFGIEPPLHRRRLDFFMKSRGFSIAKARRELGYEPKIDLDAGFGATYRWYCDRGLL